MRQVTCKRNRQRGPMGEHMNWRFVLPPSARFGVLISSENDEMQQLNGRH